MTHETARDTIDALDDLLDTEREAVLAGDLEKITRSLELKEALIDRLNKQDVEDRVELESLNSKVVRNQELLNTALAGIRSVSRRLAAMRRIRSSMDTYDAEGRKCTIDLSTDRSVEKRA